MLIVRVHGGLGNQMYEYALTYALKETYPNQTIKLDVSDFYRFKAHTGYSLKSCFNIQDEIATEEEIKALYPGAIYNKKYQQLHHRVRFVVDKIEYVKTKTEAYKRAFQKNVITDFRHNIFNDVVFQLDADRDFYFMGYWQNICYFDQYREALRTVFTPVKKIPDQFLAVVAGPNTVSVHVRRGDYVGSVLDLCGETYYRTAIELIREKVGAPKFIFFTDDEKYVTDTFQWVQDKKIIANPPEDCDVDMKLMSMCRHHIIANSSFSFWGAYLGEEDGIVVAPEKWMRVEGGYCGINMPREWKVIRNG